MPQRGPDGPCGCRDHRYGGGKDEEPTPVCQGTRVSGPGNGPGRFLQHAARGRHPQWPSHHPRTSTLWLVGGLVVGAMVGTVVRVGILGHRQRCSKLVGAMESTPTLPKFWKPCPSVMLRVWASPPAGTKNHHHPHYRSMKRRITCSRRKCQCPKNASALKRPALALCKFLPLQRRCPRRGDRVTGDEEPGSETMRVD